MFEDTKGVIRIRKSKKDRRLQWPKEKWIIRNLKSQKDKQYNGKTNLQNTMQKILNRATRTH